MQLRRGRQKEARSGQGQDKVRARSGKASWTGRCHRRARLQDCADVARPEQRPGKGLEPWASGVLGSQCCEGRGLCRGSAAGRRVRAMPAEDSVRGGFRNWENSAVVVSRGEKKTEAGGGAGTGRAEAGPRPGSAHPPPAEWAEQGPPGWVFTAWRPAGCTSGTSRAHRGLWCSSLPLLGTLTVRWGRTGLRSRLPLHPGLDQPGPALPRVQGQGLGLPPGQGSSGWPQFPVLRPTSQRVGDEA